MKNISLVFILLLVGCSTTPVPRTKFSDKNMRVMIDPASISVEHHVRIQSALVRSEKWAVIDRTTGLRAITKEQEMLHRTNSDRFEDKEKWAHWGKLYGVGAVVVAHAQCFQHNGFWSAKNVCQQFLNLVDANTGEIIVAVEATNDSKVDETPDWNECVENLNAVYPEAFEVFVKHQRLLDYEAESKEHATRQKEEKMAEEKNL